MKGLHLYGNGVDLVIAESADEAQELFGEPYGDDPPERDRPFERVPDDKVLTLTYEDEPDGGPQTNTAAEWAACNVKGLLASSQLYD